MSVSAGRTSHIPSPLLSGRGRTPAGCPSLPPPRGAQLTFQNREGLCSVQARTRRGLRLVPRDVGRRPQEAAQTAFSGSRGQEGPTLAFGRPPCRAHRHPESPSPRRPGPRHQEAGEVEATLGSGRHLCRPWLALVAAMSQPGRAGAPAAGSGRSQGETRAVPGPPGSPRLRPEAVGGPGEAG